MRWVSRARSTKVQAVLVKRYRHMFGVAGALSG
jgi:hypothetical protein